MIATGRWNSSAKAARATGYEPSSLIAKNPVSYASLIHADDRTRSGPRFSMRLPSGSRSRWSIVSTRRRARRSGGNKGWGSIRTTERSKRLKDSSPTFRSKWAEAELKTLAETLEHRVVDRTAKAEQQAVQLRDMAWEVTEAEQRERRRLAQVLHDHLQQLLVAAPESEPARSPSRRGGPAP